MPGGMQPMRVGVRRANRDLTWPRTYVIAGQGSARLAEQVDAPGFKPRCHEASELDSRRRQPSSSPLIGLEVWTPGPAHNSTSPLSRTDTSLLRGAADSAAHS